MIFHCPECGMLIDDELLILHHFDMDCPRCGKAKDSGFLIGVPDPPEPIDSADWWKDWP